MGGQPTRWVALDRSGQTSELASSVGFSQLVAAPDGYAYLWASDASASPLLTLEYRSGARRCSCGSSKCRTDGLVAVVVCADADGGRTDGVSLR